MNEMLKPQSIPSSSFLWDIASVDDSFEECGSCYECYSTSAFSHNNNQNNNNMHHITDLQLQQDQRNISLVSLSSLMSRSSGRTSSMVSLSSCLSTGTTNQMPRTCSSSSLGGDGVHIGSNIRTLSCSSLTSLHQDVLEVQEEEREIAMAAASLSSCAAARICEVDIETEEAAIASVIPNDVASSPMRLKLAAYSLARCTRQHAPNPWMARDWVLHRLKNTAAAATEIDENSSTRSNHSTLSLTNGNKKRDRKGQHQQIVSRSNLISSLNEHRQDHQWLPRSALCKNITSNISGGIGSMASTSTYEHGSCFANSTINFEQKNCSNRTAEAGTIRNAQNKVIDNEVATIVTLKHVCDDIAEHMLSYLSAPDIRSWGETNRHNLLLSRTEHLWTQTCRRSDCWPLLHHLICRGGDERSNHCGTSKSSEGETASKNSSSESSSENDCSNVKIHFIDSSFLPMSPCFYSLVLLRRPGRGIFHESNQIPPNLSVLHGLTQPHPLHIDPVYFTTSSSKDTDNRNGPQFRTFRIPQNKNEVQLNSISVVQFLGEVGLGDQCVRSDEPFPKVQVKNTMSAHQTRATKWCPPMLRNFLVNHGTNNAAPSLPLLRLQHEGRRIGAFYQGRLTRASDPALPSTEPNAYVTEEEVAVGRDLFNGHDLARNFGLRQRERQQQQQRQVNGAINQEIVHHRQEPEGHDTNGDNTNNNQRTYHNQQSSPPPTAAHQPFSCASLFGICTTVRPFVHPYVTRIIHKHNDNSNNENESNTNNKSNNLKTLNTNSSKQTIIELNVTPRLFAYFEVSILPRDISSEPSCSDAPPTTARQNRNYQQNTAANQNDDNNNNQQQHQPDPECVAIGLSKINFNTDKKMPGWDNLSYGYHGDDGGIFHGDGDMLRRFGPNFGVGDTVGCGIDYANRGIFFTHNGVFLGYAWINADLGQSLYPTIGIDTRCFVSANFGDRPFEFDLGPLSERHEKWIATAFSGFPVSVPKKY
eukprot:CAMPEP_0194395138 /NCGR_PEP_ID=MMETSP0174-20130528/124252_1 /TAXON_ID=216777 /ORGANISM="Proboscia alata, Strain PI-D3" /LENGTH=984 /DNA_ID=CAMNT_0039191031 /DNA_START=167 /DNA_END=3121 /DNA_ORIENTATION=+